MAITSALEESAKVTEEAWEDMACPGALCCPRAWSVSLKPGAYSQLSLTRLAQDQGMVGRDQVGLSDDQGG